MSNITLREKEVFLAVSHLGNVLLKIRKEKKKKNGMEEDKTSTVHRRENTKSAALLIRAPLSDLRCLA